ncbi:MAG: restriction endonuclease subunit S, partial [Desulfobacterales bacterium]|nr:restriction endonuclease subunit S [Desulfobacterales bacterium]
MRHKEDVSIEWKQKSFMECLVPVSFDRLKQVQANSYLIEGKCPVVDQGQNLISGWTNDGAKIINENLPLIIFGDHTRIFKYVDFPFALGADGTKLIKPKQDEFSAKFFYYYLLTLNIPERGYNRHYKLLKEQSIRYPSIVEQQKIAAVLFKIQKAIEIQESIIEKTRELKKSTLHHAFTHGLHREKLKETEIGPMPESWEAARVGKHCQKPEYGFTESAIADEIGPKFLRITDITENGVNWNTVPYCRCSQNLFPKYELKENDILFARIGATTGKSHIVKNPPRAIFASYLIRLRPLYDVVPAYLYDFFNSEAYWDQVNANKKNNLKGGVNSSFLSDIIFPLPSKSEQMEIANIILTIDHKIEIYTAKKTALQDLFKTMLNKLMTGEIRVKDL